MAINYPLIDMVLSDLFPLSQKTGVILRDWEETELADYNFIQECVWDADPDATVCFGMSKLVITSPNFNGVVIKIPFKGMFHEWEEFSNDPSVIQEQELEDGWISHTVTEWQPFRCAAAPLSRMADAALYEQMDKTDYCLTEFLKYSKLKTFCLDCFVAKTSFYKIINGFRIFLQEEVIAEDNLYDIKHPSKNSLDLANKWYNNKKFYIDVNWIANCLDFYGQSKVKRFLNYCANIDPVLLNDMHGGNFGYRKNGSPCLLDFSDFCD